MSDEPQPDTSKNQQTHQPNRRTQPEKTPTHRSNPNTTTPTHPQPTKSAETHFLVPPAEPRRPRPGVIPGVVHSVRAGSAERADEGAQADDRDRRARKVEQVGVARDDGVGADRHGQSDEVVVARITTQTRRSRGIVLEPSPAPHVGIEAIGCIRREQPPDLRPPGERQRSRRATLGTRRSRNGPQCQPEPPPERRQPA